VSHKEAQKAKNLYRSGVCFVGFCASLWQFLMREGMTR